MSGISDSIRQARTAIEDILHVEESTGDMLAITETRLQAVLTHLDTIEQAYQDFDETVRRATNQLQGNIDRVQVAQMLRGARGDTA